MPFTGSKLIQWCGLANILAGLGTALYWFLHPGLDAVVSRRWMMVNAMFVGVLVMTLIGLIGLYGRQSEKAGALGFIGFLLSFVSTSLFVGAGIFDAFINPVLTERAKELVDPKGPLMGGPMGMVFAMTGVCFALGFLLFAIATIRAKVFPVLAAVMLLVGAPVLGLSPLMPVIVRTLACLIFGAANIWLGYVLWSKGEAAA